MSVATEVVAVESVLLGPDNQAENYAEFRRHIMSHVHSGNFGTQTNINMRRNNFSQKLLMSSDTNPTGDPNYWEKRRKNNEAAKRFRVVRRVKEDEIAIRCAFLEQENLRLRYEMAALRN